MEDEWTLVHRGRQRVRQYTRYPQGDRGYSQAGGMDRAHSFSERRRGHQFPQPNQPVPPPRPAYDPGPLPRSYADAARPGPRGPPRVEYQERRTFSPHANRNTTYSRPPQPLMRGDFPRDRAPERHRTQPHSRSYADPIRPRHPYRDGVPGGRREQHHPHTYADNTRPRPQQFTGRENSARDRATGFPREPAGPQLGPLIRKIYKIIRTVHHLQNVAPQADKPTPRMIARMVDILGDMIKPASPSQQTCDLIVGNAKNWGHLACHLTL